MKLQKHLLGFSLLAALTAVSFSACRETEDPVPGNYLSVSVAGEGSVTSLPSGISCDPDCEQVFDAKVKSVKLTATARPGHKFVSWGKACATSTTASCTITVTKHTQVEANFEELPPGKIALTVEKVGDGTGTLFTVPAGIDCGSTCSEAFDEDSNVTIAAKHGDNSVFDGWVEGSACATAPAGRQAMQTAAKAAGVTEEVDAICTVKMTEALTIGAKFSPKPISLTVTKVGKATGQVTSLPSGIDCGDTCKKDFPILTVIKLTATKESNVEFAGWGGACASFGIESECEVTLSEAKSVTAEFQPILPGKFTVGLLKTGSGGGTIVSAPAGLNCGTNCSEPFNANQTIQLTATPASGSNFVGWSGACSGTNPVCTFTLTANTTATAEFSGQSMKLSSSVFGNGSIESTDGLVNCSGSCATSFSYNQQVTLVAKPGIDSDFVNWTGACSGTNSICTVTMSEAKTVGAVFMQQTYNLSTQSIGPAGSDGLISVSGDVTGVCPSCHYQIARGANLTFTAGSTNPTGVLFKNWGGACAEFGSNPVCTLSNISSNKSVTANFEYTNKHLSVLVNRTGDATGIVFSTPGSINCGSVCDADFVHGTQVTLTAIPGANTRFMGWSGGGCSGIDTCTVTMTNVRNIQATFQKIRHTLTYIKAGSGFGSIGLRVGTTTVFGNCSGNTCTAEFDQGTTVTVVPQYTVGVFSGWSGACGGTGECAIYMNEAKTVTGTFPAQYSITVSTTGAGAGKITSSTPASLDCGTRCNAIVNEGTIVTLYPSAPNGSHFVSWGGACSGTANFCNVTMNQSKTVTARFEP